jgi:hypothetical protein
MQITPSKERSILDWGGTTIGVPDKGGSPEGSYPRKDRPLEVLIEAPAA